ncbi:hypothetical protein INR49_005950, partial [Caranx melampygus]
METLASTASLVTLDTRGLVLSNWLELKQLVHTEPQLCQDLANHSTGGEQARRRTVWTGPGQTTEQQHIVISLRTSADLQGQSVVISNVDLITVAVVTKTIAM